ncbi:hypothetical protein P7C71_g2597, partial [Lecanoromycetidae sp. Uapishka_2]
MLVGLCGSICAGKNSVAEYLTDNLGFMRLHLNHLPSVEDSKSKQINSAYPAHGQASRSFEDVESLLDFVTKQWKQRWVTTDVWNEDILENLHRRPSFILVSVDAPIARKSAS